MTLSEIKRILAEEDLQLTKSLGQNFLHDGNQLQRIIAAAELEPSDQVLEIGPGLGPLTKLLLARAQRVMAIEVDRRLVRVLERRLCPQAGARFHLVHHDALAFLQREPIDWHDWKVVSNLPYSVASPLLVELAQHPRCPRRIVATLQIEVAKRLMAAPGDADYGVLSLLVQLHYEARTWFRIPAGCFFPEPDVDSACVCLARRPEPLLAPALREPFLRIVKRSFSQRRKMMLKLLRADWGQPALESAFGALALPHQVRAEKVGLDQFVALTRLLAGAHPATPSSEDIFDVVNERDEVIGRRPRGEVHRLGLMHRAVHVMVFNDRGQVFLQKRSMTKDRQPGLWDSSASGHVDSGEGYDQAAVREAREEIGLVLPRAPRRLFKLGPSAETDQEHVWVYRCTANGPFALHPDEIERGDWFDPAQLNRWIAESPRDFASAFLAIWPRICQSSAP